MYLFRCTLGLFSYSVHKEIVYSPPLSCQERKDALHCPEDIIYSSHMKKDTHPEYYPKATVSCACGNTFTIGSTKKEISVEICYACHPTYTGKKKLIDTAGRVEKFKARQEKASKKPTRKKSEKRAVKAKKKETKKPSK